MPQIKGNPKSLFERVVELFYALRLLQDSKEKIKEGFHYYLVVIYGQLRALLTDPTQRVTDPLLLHLCLLYTSPSPRD